MKSFLATLFLETLLIAAVSMNGPAQQAKPEEPLPTYSVPEAYEVYSTILPDEWTWRYANSKTLLIQTETVSQQMCLEPDAKWKKLLDPAIANYRIVNRKPLKLDRLFDISKSYTLSASDALQAAFKGAGPDGWDGFNAAHPDSVGWIELSAVGFNDSKTVAVVYVGHHCGRLCGGGGFSVLEKIQGKWKPVPWVGSSCAWAS